MSPSGTLWVITGSRIRSYTGLPSSPTPGPEISGLSAPVAVMVRPSGEIVVADGGTSQTMKGFPSTGGSQPTWIYGRPGGYMTGNPDVTNNSFGFEVGNRGNRIYHTPLASQASDDSIWIGDGATDRLLHLRSDRSFQGAIMYLANNGSSCADLHVPKRVIGAEFLEFEVDYRRPLQDAQSWVLKKNWAAGLQVHTFTDVQGAVKNRYFSDSGFTGLRSVITFLTGKTYGQTQGNGRTYALLTDWAPQPDGRKEPKEIVELPVSGACPDPS